MHKTFGWFSLLCRGTASGSPGHGTHRVTTTASCTTITKTLSAAIHAQTSKLTAKWVLRACWAWKRAERMPQYAMRAWQASEHGMVTATAISDARAGAAQMSSRNKQATDGLAEFGQRADAHMQQATRARKHGCELKKRAGTLASCGALELAALQGETCLQSSFKSYIFATLG